MDHATHTRLVIEKDGTFTPSTLDLQAGDTLVVHAKADVVLCLDSPQVFGESRYEIPQNTKLDLTVAPRAPRQFDFLVFTGDLSQPCKGSRGARTGEGSGKVEGGPG